MAQTKVQLLMPNLGDVIDFDSSTLFMDGADNRVGIRNTNPQYELDVTGTVNATNFRGNIQVGTIDDWIVHTGDTDTKIGFPAADKFQVFAGGGPRTTVTSTGLGIGTDSPAQLLNLASSNPMIRLTDTDGSAYSEIGGESGNLYLYTNDPSRDVIFRGSEEVARITGDGNLGIGTYTPTQPLHLNRSSSGQAEFGMRLSYENTAGGGTVTNCAVLIGGTGLKFKNYNSSRHFYFETGNVAIGSNTVPTGTLELSRTNSTDMLTFREVGANALFAKIGYNSASGTSILDIRSEGHMRFLTGGNNQQLRIDNTGVIETGTAIGASGFDSNARLRVGRAGDCNIAIRVTGNTTSHTGIYFGDSDSSSSGYIQYMHNGDYMRFMTNGASASNERLRIASDGHVAIGGQFDPESILDVREDKDGAETQIRLYNTDNGDTTTQTAALYLSPDSRGAAKTGLRAIKENASFATNAGRDISLTLNVTQNNAQVEGLRIYSNGNVAINSAGTATNLLDVRKDATSTKVHIGSINGQLGSMPNSSEYGVSLVGNNAEFQIHKDASGNYQLILGTYQGSIDMPLVFRTDNRQERMRITKGGNVGINATNPNAKFQIEGDSAYAVTSSGRVVEGIDVNATAGGSGNYGSGISFGAGATGRAAIVSLQGAADADNVGLAVITHPTGTGAADGVEKLRITSAGDLIVGGESVGEAGSFGIQQSGHVRTVLASGTVGDTLFGAIGGVSNGFQINTAANNNQIYTFHNGSSIGLRISADGKVGLGIDPVYSFQQRRSGHCEWVIGSSTAGGATLVFDGDANGDASGGDYSHIRHTTDGNMEYAARNGSGNAAHHMFKTNTNEQLRIHDDGIVAQPFGPTQHNGGSATAIINTTGRFKVGGNQFQTNYKQNMGTGIGWYTIAINSGGRASGRIGIRETYSSRHQACVFYAAHHYGGSSNQNCINTIFSSGRHSGNPIGAIRIKAYGVYDGALLQVYVRDASHGLQAYLLGDNMQDQGWIMKDWITDGTDPGGMSNWSAINSNGGVAAYSDMNEIQGGGASFDGHVIPGRDNTATLGRGSYRWNTIYGMSSSINTSDETLKQDIASLTTAEMNAAKRLSALFKTYRWKESVVEKGTDKARTHSGIIAQSIKTAMEAESLDPNKYSFYCIDEWYEDSEGTKLSLNTATREGDSVEEGTNAELGGSIVVPSGFNKVTRYSVRYEELFAFIAAYNEQRFASIESRLTALES